MGQKVLIIGSSGTGKSTSLRNFERDEVCFINVAGKMLPFRGGFNEMSKTDKVAEIIKTMKSTDKKVIVIDDAQYIMGKEFFRRANEQGWNKFTDIGKNFFDLLEAVDDLPVDVIVYLIMHTEKDADGNIKIKTIGKMLDEKLTIEGLATIVLMSSVVDGVYTFQTQNSGKDICKSPMGMFKNYLIDNDLKMVDGIIREYYGFTDFLVEEVGVQAEKSTRGRRGQTQAPAEPVVERPKRERKPKVVEEEIVVQEAVVDDVSGDEFLQQVNEQEQSQAPVEEPVVEQPVRRERKKREVVETATNEPVGEKTDTTPRRKSMAEKLAEAGYGEPQQETPVRRSRMRGE